MNIINYFRQNKLTTLLLLVVLYLLFKNNNISPLRPVQYSAPMMQADVAVPLGGGGGGGVESKMVFNQIAPQPEIKNRMVITDSSLALQVKDVAKTLAEIKKITEGVGGYMVDSNLNRPEEAASGNITVRVPAKKTDEVLNNFRELAVKVVSENLIGTDVTDQYVDNDARMAILLKNMARFDEIMVKAVNVDDILRVQQEIFNIQSQLDSIKGQQLYLSKNAEMVRITLYLATDELALPYAPDQAWRPELVFKQAVRSLVLSVRQLGTALIWILVFSIVWVPVLLVFLFVRRKFFK